MKNKYKRIFLNITGYITEEVKRLVTNLACVTGSHNIISTDFLNKL